MRKTNKTILAILVIFTGILWRMGGSDKYDKLWRRIGCTAVMSGYLILNSSVELLQAVIILGMIAWGAWSYFGWMNYIVRIWYKSIEMKREYWWNFLAEGLVIQESILVVSPSIENGVTGALCATVGALGKVWIDKLGVKWQAVASELYFGSVMLAGIIINVN